MLRFLKQDEAQPTQKIRFEQTSLTGIWASVRRHLTAPTHPSTTSESAHGSGIYAETDIYDGHGMRSPSGNHLPLELIDPVAASRRRKGFGSLLRPKNRSQGNGTSPGDTWKKGKTSGPSGSARGEDEEGPFEPVSSVVVDNDFEQVVPHAARSDSGSTVQGASNTHLSHGPKEGSSLFGKSEATGTVGQERRNSAQSDGHCGEGSTKGGKRDRGMKRWVQSTWGYELIFGTIWPSINYFFDSRYTDPHKERAFMKETWFQSKMGAMASAVFFLISWALSTGLQPKITPFVLIAYLGVGGLFTIPLFLMIAFNFPRRRDWIWQPMLLGASWVLADVVIIEAYRCHFFSTNNTCGTKNFLNMLGFAFGQPVLALLAMRQSRLFATIGAAQWLVLAGVLLMTQNKSPTLFYRNMVNFALFHAFLIGTSFLRERGDRHMFEMRQQLKLQFRATQSAQVMERKASDSKRRFVSYIFHEVRVPLNTALLAVQNLEGENVFKHIQADQNEMVHGLMRSLTTMEKVLNDVLSFNRMEAGKFAQARKPFDFHKSINLVAMSHRPQANAAGIGFHVELDPDIDKIGGVFVGDEMRLRQITSNLVSNSVKFTEEGSVRIVTKLIYPRLDVIPDATTTTDVTDEVDSHLKEAAENQAKQQQHHIHQSQNSYSSDGVKRFSADSGRLIMSMPMSTDPEKGSIHLESLRHSSDPKMLQSVPMVPEKREGDRTKQKAIVRVEIHDTGIGLKKDDLDDQRLFSPYVQTEIGRRQGGKGSGLGLALVRQIVRLSNGRLGVDSEYGKGSVFWFELPYAIPPPSARSRAYKNPSASPHASRPPTLPSVMAVPTIDEESLNACSPSLERDDPLEAIEHRESILSPPSSHGHGQSQDPVRPRMSETESTIPLLSRTTTDGTRRTSVTTEEVIVTTYPPPDSGSSTDSTFDQHAAMTLAANTNINERRRDSEWSTSASGESSRRPSEQGPPIAPSGRRKASTQTTDDEPPLCAFVVDDDRLTRMLMSRMLTRLGHQVTMAENGKIALQMIKDGEAGVPGVPKFDVCFLDNQMPYMSGVEVVRALREANIPLYVVGCTGNALREDQDEYFSAGADGIIPKPVHQKTVLEQIKEARKRVAGETKPKPIQPSY